MRMDEDLLATLSDGCDWTGLFTAATAAELAPIAALLADHAPDLLARYERYQLERGRHDRYPDLLASAVAGFAFRVTGRKKARKPFGLAEWAIEKLSTSACAAQDIHTLDVRLLEILAERSGTRQADPAGLAPYMPEQRPDESALLRLAVEIAALRQRKLRRLGRWRRLLGLLGDTRTNLEQRTRQAVPAKAEPASPADTGSKLEQTDWRHLLSIAGKLPIEIWEKKLKEARMEIGRFNIIVAGRTGVGKTTLIGAIFGEEVGNTLAGRPRTRGRIWYPENPTEEDILRLCDTEGLEMERYEETLDGLRHELKRRNASRDPFDHVHVAWLCIDEPSLTVQPGEEKAVELFHENGVPVICVLTKAGMAPDFKRTVEELLPQCAKVVRVRAAPIEIEGQTFVPMGLDDLIAATEAVIPDSAARAWAVAARNLSAMVARSMRTVWGAAAAAGASGATPLPFADAAGVFGVQAGMIVSVSLQMGIKLQRQDLQAMAVTLIGALGLTAGGRFLAGQVIKFVPGIGSITGAAITGGTAAALTYGLGHAYVEYLRRFYQRHNRMPEAQEVVSGFQEFWRKWRKKQEPPPATPSLRSRASEAIGDGQRGA